MGVTLAETADGWRSGAAEQLRVKSGGASGARECLANPATGLKKSYYKIHREEKKREEDRLAVIPHTPDTRKGS